MDGIVSGRYVCTQGWQVQSMKFRPGAMLNGSERLTGSRHESSDDRKLSTRTVFDRLHLHYSPNVDGTWRYSFRHPMAFDEDLRSICIPTAVPHVGSAECNGYDVYFRRLATTQSASISTPGAG